jgi:hypothetical protein
MGETGQHWVDRITTPEPVRTTPYLRAPTLANPTYPDALAVQRIAELEAENARLQEIIDRHVKCPCVRGGL